ncbi:MAG: glycosyltransferase [Chitinophagaceae bacterium]|nr:MAG: glycosyltransferase [Chitinophagaceae bacterium]
MPESIEISLVIPVYNEQELIEQLFERTTGALEKITPNFEIICVNDGSTDNTLELLLACHQKDNRFKVVELSRNFGHQAAYTAGLSYAKGNFTVMMDGDLQDPPEIIAEMYKKITTEELDVVFGSRTERKEGFLKRSLIKLFHKIFSRLSNINAPKNVGNFSIMNRSALNAFLKLGEKNRYLPGLRFFIGFKQGFIEYSRPDREVGDAKMNFTSLLTLALDAIYSFSKVPIKVCIIIGLLGIFFSVVGVVVVLVKKIMGEAITGWTSIMLSIFFIGSVQLLFLGILGEYIHRIFIETQNRPIFIVRKYHE